MRLCSRLWQEITRERRPPAGEHEAVRQIQSLLPLEVPQVEHLSVAVGYRPVSAVGADFYDFLQCDNRHLGILLADVAGRGVAAVQVASRIKEAFSSQSPRASNPSLVLSAMNRLFFAELGPQCVTAGYLFLDLEKRQASYAAAGHPPLLFWEARDRRVLELAENGLFLGALPDCSYYTIQHSIRPGDRILLYTDGLTGVEDPAGEYFGLSRLKKFLAAHAGLEAEGFVRRLLREVYSWSGNGNERLEDDLALLVIDIQ